MIKTLSKGKAFLHSVSRNISENQASSSARIGAVFNFYNAITQTVHVVALVAVVAVVAAVAAVDAASLSFPDLLGTSQLHR